MMRSIVLQAIGMEAHMNQHVIRGPSLAPGRRGSGQRKDIARSLVIFSLAIQFMSALPSGQRLSNASLKGVIKGHHSAGQRE